VNFGIRVVGFFKFANGEFIDEDTLQLGAG
jgi:hypothetical protein